MSTDKTQKLFAKLYRKPKQFITAVDNLIKSNKKFTGQLRNEIFSSEIAVKGIPRLYMTQIKELEKFQEFSQEKNSPKIQYALAIADLIQQPDLLQPPSTPEINLKGLPIIAIGTHNPTDPADFWNNYNSLSQENKNQVNERLLAVLDMQKAALQNLKFHLDSKNTWTREFGLQQALVEINRQAELITTGQSTPQKAYEALTTHINAQKKVFEDLRKVDKTNAPLSSTLSDLRHKMSSAVSHTAKAMAYSAHSFFTKKSPVSMKPTFVSHVKRLEEEMQAENNASRPSFSL